MFDSPIPISHKWSIDVFSSVCDGFRKFYENINSASRCRLRAEMTSPFDSATPISDKWSVDNFRLSSFVQKLLTHFDFWLGYSFGGIFGKIAPLD